MAINGIFCRSPNRCVFLAVLLTHLPISILSHSLHPLSQSLSLPLSIPLSLSLRVIAVRTKFDSDGRIIVEAQAEERPRLKRVKLAIQNIEGRYAIEKEREKVNERK